MQTIVHLYHSLDFESGESCNDGNELTADSDGGEPDEADEEEEPSDYEERRLSGRKAKHETSHLGMALKSVNLSLADQEELALELLSRKHM